MGKFEGAILKVRSIIEEFSIKTMDRMMAANTLLERAFLPSLLSGACNWTGVTNNSEDDCDELIYH